MKRNPLGARDRRALVWGALILAPALFLRVVLVPFGQEVRQRQDHLASQRELLSRELALLTRAKAFPARLDAAGAALLHLAPAVFDGGQPMLVVGEVEAYVGELARIGPVAIEHLQGAAAEAVGPGIFAVRVGLKGKGDLEGILGLLGALETGPKFARVEHLGIQRAESPPHLDYEVLAFSMEIDLFALSGEDALSSESIEAADPRRPSGDDQ